MSVSWSFPTWLSGGRDWQFWTSVAESLVAEGTSGDKHQQEQEQEQDQLGLSRGTVPHPENLVLPLDFHQSPCKEL